MERAGGEATWAVETEDSKFPSAFLHTFQKEFVLKKVPFLSITGCLNAK